MNFNIIFAFEGNINKQMLISMRRDFFRMQREDKVFIQQIPIHHERARILSKAVMMQLLSFLFLLIVLNTFATLKVLAIVVVGAAVVLTLYETLSPLCFCRARGIHAASNYRRTLEKE